MKRLVIKKFFVMLIICYKFVVDDVFMMYVEDII